MQLDNSKTILLDTMQVIAYKTTQKKEQKPVSKTTLKTRAIALGASGIAFVIIGVFGVLISHL